MASEIIKTLTDATFDQELKDAATPIIVDFWAPWCGPCRTVGPIIEEIASEHAGKVAVGKLNVDENQSTAGKYGIMSIPTIILFRRRRAGEEGHRGAQQARLRARVRARLRP